MSETQVVNGIECTFRIVGDVDPNVAKWFAKYGTKGVVKAIMPTIGTLPNPKSGSGVKPAGDGAHVAPRLRGVMDPATGKWPIDDKGKEVKRFEPVPGNYTLQAGTAFKSMPVPLVNPDGTPSPLAGAFRIQRNTSSSIVNVKPVTFDDL